MKNLSKVFAFAIVALGLSACGNVNNNPYGQNGYYNPQTGQWQQTGYPGTAQGGCVPLQSGALSFTAQGAAVNGAVILAGTLPANSTRPGQYGQVVMGGGGAIPQQGYGYGSLQLMQPQTSSGVIQMTVSQNYVSGMIQMSPSVIQALMQTAGGNQFTQYNSNICVSSIAIDAVYTTQGYQGQGLIRQALVYFYLNNGQPVGPVPFYSNY